MASVTRRKSTLCTTSTCIEVAEVPDVGILLRNSTVPEVNIFASREELRAFVAGAKAGEFDDLV